MIGRSSAALLIAAAALVASQALALPPTLPFELPQAPEESRETLDSRPPLPDGAAVVARTDRFVLVATPGATGLAEALAREVEALRDRIADDLGRDYQGVTEIRVADRGSAFQALQPHGRRVPSWAVGIAWPHYNLVVINAGHGRRPAEIRRTLAHEISHIALGRLAPSGFPRWFLEGMAMYHSKEWRISGAGTIAGAVMRDGIIPFRDLERSWPHTPAEVRLAYAQSNDFVAWLFRTVGKPAIHELVSEVADGAPFEEAVETATGRPFWDLEYAWRGGLATRYTWVPAITSGGFVWGVASVLFILAYLRKRGEKRRRLRAMAELEEPDDFMAEPEPVTPLDEGLAYPDEDVDDGERGPPRLLH